jgi:hypothetical protein
VRELRLITSQGSLLLRQGRLTCGQLSPSLLDGCSLLGDLRLHLRDVSLLLDYGGPRLADRGARLGRLSESLVDPLIYVRRLDLG